MLTREEHRSLRGFTDAELVAYVRNQPYSFPADDDVANRLEELAARVRELEGRTCDRCVFRKREPWDADWCDNISGDTIFSPVILCGKLGNTCGAFKEKA